MGAEGPPPPTASQQGDPPGSGWVHSRGWKETFQREIACAGDPSQSTLTRVPHHGGRTGKPSSGQPGRGIGPELEGPHPGCPQPWDQGPPLQLTLGLSSTSRPGGLRGLLGPKHLVGAARADASPRAPETPPTPASCQPSAWAERALLPQLTPASDTGVVTPG